MIDIFSRIRPQNGEKWYLLLVAFTCGMCIMAIELSASRLLAPYFGTSTFIWTNIIGIIMVALTIGYYAGGKLADLKPKKEKLLFVQMIAALYLIAVPFIVRPVVSLLFSHAGAVITFLPIAIVLGAATWFVAKRVGRPAGALALLCSLMVGMVLIMLADTLVQPIFARIGSFAPFLFWGSAVAVSVLFLPPIMLLGATGPYVIKLLTQMDRRVGADAGSVFAISTFGSIIGTFAPTLLTIPLLGTRRSIILFALLMLTVSGLGLLRTWWRRAALLSLVFFLFLPFPVYKHTAGAIAEAESVYQYMQVIDQGDMRMLSINEGLGIFSMLDLRRTLTGKYFDFFTLLPYFVQRDDADRSVLILGEAAGSFSTQMHRLLADRFDLHIDGVEIDAKILELARKYFFIENPSLTLHVADGRQFLRTAGASYDVAIVDAYSNLMYIPPHLSTREFFSELKASLRPGGLVAMNVNASTPDSHLLNAITNTLHGVFSHVYVFNDPEMGWNYMIIASDTVLPFAEVYNGTEFHELQAAADRFYGAVAEWPYDPASPVLTDDRAPIEYLTDWEVLSYFTSQLK